MVNKNNLSDIDFIKKNIGKFNTLDEVTKFIYANNLNKEGLCQHIVKLYLSIKKGKVYSIPGHVVFEYNNKIYDPIRVIKSLVPIDSEIYKNKLKGKYVSPSHYEKYKERLNKLVEKTLKLNKKYKNYEILFSQEEEPVGFFISDIKKPNGTYISQKEYDKIGYSEYQYEFKYLGKAFDFAKKIINKLENKNEKLEAIGDKQYYLKWSYSDNNFKWLRDLKLSTKDFIILDDLQGVMFNNTLELKKMKYFSSLFKNVVFFKVGGNSYAYRIIKR